MKIAVLGCGNMATPIIQTIFSNDKSLNFFTYTPSQTKAIDLAHHVQGTHVKELADFANIKDEIDFWFIACKPQQFNDLALKIKNYTKDQKVISIMAAITVESISKALACSEIYRVMPNTPIAIAQGISLIYKNENCSKANSRMIKTWFEYCGDVIETKTEKEFDELMLFSGSGPGYLFYIADAYFQKLVSMGHDINTARKLINKLFVGSSLLMGQSEESLNTLCKNVTSKGGVTQAALEHLESNYLHKLISDSISAANERSKQLTRI